MTKLFIFLLTLTLASIASMWFIENDGSITIDWLGYRVQTSVAFAILSSVVIMVLLTTIVQMLLWIKSAPKRYKKARVDKKRENGLMALTEGFAAIAAGDTKQARRLTKQATQYLGNIPLTKLLSAQTAQLEGNMELAKVHYTAMLESKETETIAIKGLLIQAKKDGDINKAIFLAEKAISLKPNADWALLMLMDLYKITRRWFDAEKIVHRVQKLKIISIEESRRYMAIIYNQICADFVENGNNELALKYAEKAYKLLPGFAPIAVNYAKILLKTGNMKKASKSLEYSWKISPHPEIAEFYMELHIEENADKKIKRAERLLNLSRSQSYGHLIVAKTALACDNITKARNHLKMAISIRETRYLCRLMAELEKQAGSSRDVIDQWKQRAETSNADPLWSCSKCGFNTEIWESNCHNCDAFDSLKWNEATSKINIINPVREALPA